jgi:hypothetical protein
LTIFFDEKACLEVVYMVEAWSVVGFMVWGLRMVWIYGLKRGKQAKYREL